MMNMNNEDGQVNHFQNEFDNYDNDVIKVVDHSVNPNQHTLQQNQ